MDDPGGSTPAGLSGACVRLETEWTWDGNPVEPGDRAAFELRFGVGTLEILVDAPLRGDPPPPAPPGSYDGLWEHEVAELFLLGADERYLEVEIGPHGHHLVLSLHGRRRRTAVEPAIDYRVAVEGGRWRGVARIPARLLPPGLDRLNAYAVSGSRPDRRHLAWRAVPGPSPDFHRLERFGRLADLSDD